jgi:hypothetical protein
LVKRDQWVGGESRTTERNGTRARLLARRPAMWSLRSPNFGRGCSSRSSNPAGIDQAIVFAYDHGVVTPGAWAP